MFEHIINTNLIDSCGFCTEIAQRKRKKISWLVSHLIDHHSSIHSRCFSIKVSVHNFFVQFHIHKNKIQIKFKKNLNTYALIHASWLRKMCTKLNLKLSRSLDPHKKSLGEPFTFTFHLSAKYKFNIVRSNVSNAIDSFAKFEMSIW